MNAPTTSTKDKMHYITKVYSRGNKCNIKNSDSWLAIHVVYQLNLLSLEIVVSIPHSLHYISYSSPQSSDPLPSS